MKGLLAIAAALAILILLHRWIGSQGGGASESGGPVDGTVGPPQTDGPGSSAGEYGPSVLDEMAQAIFQREGSQPGDINFDNMNPGDLKSAPGMTGTDRGYATFGSFTDGFGVLKNYIAQHATAHPDWDFYDFFDWYLRGSTTAPGVDAQGNSDTYADYVANYLNVPATMPVSAALGK